MFPAHLGKRFWYGYLVPGKSYCTYPEQQDSPEQSLSIGNYLGPGAISMYRLANVCEFE